MEGHCGFCYDGKPSELNPSDPESFPCCIPFHRIRITKVPIGKEGLTEKYLATCHVPVQKLRGQSTEQFSGLGDTEEEAKWGLLRKILKYCPWLVNDLGIRVVVRLREDTNG